MTQTPSIKTQTYESEEVMPSGGVQGSVTSGGQGLSPGETVPPARTDGVTTSAHMNAMGSKNFLIGSPVVEVVSLDGFASARTANSSTPVDSDLALFRSLADRGDFDALTKLCRERLLTARTLTESLRWSKDRAIVEILRRNFGAAFDLLSGAHWMAERTTGALRGRYENAFGLVLVEHGRTSLGLRHFGLGLRHAETAKVRADIQHNVGRAYAVRGETVKAWRYLRRALNYARAHEDLRLELEVLESIKEFGGMR